VKTEAQVHLRHRILSEVLSWAWVAAAFLLIHGTLVQARVIPSGSMERTLLVGDHLLMSRFGYDAGVPFTGWHVRLWREPHRQQVVIFRAPLAGTPLVIYMSLQAPEGAWDAGQIHERLYAYLNAVAHPRLVRWKRLFTTF